MKQYVIKEVNAERYFYHVYCNGKLAGINTAGQPINAEHFYKADADKYAKSLNKGTKDFGLTYEVVRSSF